MYNNKNNNKNNNSDNNRTIPLSINNKTIDNINNDKQFFLI